MPKKHNVRIFKCKYTTNMENYGDPKEYRDACLSCPYEECVYDKKDGAICKHLKEVKRGLKNAKKV